MFTEKELVMIAKRENNTKRSYLVVNPLQAKHVPVSPGVAMEVYQALAKEISANADVDGKKILYIGFAETATAIGAGVAAALGGYYMQTTREEVENATYFFFSETHSHATEQKLVKEDMDAIFGNVDMVIFVEDEVTTGNTIMNIVSLLEKEYGDNIKFGVASLLNGMGEEHLSLYRQHGIDLFYLVKTDHENFTKIANQYNTNENKVDCRAAQERQMVDKRTDSMVVGDRMEKMKVSYLKAAGYQNTRHVVQAARYTALCEQLYRQVWKYIQESGRIGGNQNGKRYEKILVLGTEECMFPAIYVGKRMEDHSCAEIVRTHSTTRSPIEVSDDEGYPLHTRYALDSFYEKGRKTFVYDLDAYDLVIVMTDSGNCTPDNPGVRSLIKAAAMAGNKELLFVSWEPESHMPSSYKEEDVVLLLKDITGQVEPEPTGVREQKIQNGTHYCEMLPIEYVPSAKYMEAYEEALAGNKREVAHALAVLSEKIWRERGENVVLVSLARAGIPIGILIKRYIYWKYKHVVPHYSISIIRGRGIDGNAMNYLLEHYEGKELLFVDGWIGKGAILKELRKDVEAYTCQGVRPELAVIADPANVTKLCGTHEDLLIPSSCLNATISGLVSRTFLRDDIIGEKDYHGAVYYGELKSSDLSYSFIEEIENEFVDVSYDDKDVIHEGNDERQGVDEVQEIADRFGVDDINLIKPGIGETTRVLLRRVPWKVLVAESEKNDPAIKHIYRLAKEKEVEIVYYPLQNYKTCGIIKKLADA